MDDGLGCRTVERMDARTEPPGMGSRRVPKPIPLAAPPPQQIAMEFFWIALGRLREAGSLRDTPASTSM
ncbi:hypothetical protein H2508_04280 [Parahaliea sp. F7430]|uniref:Uncharacterized protein n=1 Tax=Sediminihaliea albiluteola TaxID=2758564 RepID=A0A7W2TUS7_9GAMM|nr:hypothetical protein [Sediminihaliea albiluteola]MBA6412322.1 hypothetical protein [Sediminihaliea albiluteola]